MYIDAVEVCALLSTFVLFTGWTTGPSHPLVLRRIRNAASFQMSQNESAIFLQNQTGNMVFLNFRTAVYTVNP